MSESRGNNVTEDEVDRIIRTEFTDEFIEGYVNVGPEDTCMPVHYKKFAEPIKHFAVRDSDVVVASYLKAGTTWTQEMVWLIMNNYDLEGAKIALPERFPFFEVCTLFNFKKLDEAMGSKCPEYTYDSIEFTKNQPSPRFIKTHLPFSLLPQEIQNGSKSPKIIYVMRNPKDVCISYYHHGNILQGWKTNLQNFCKVFLAEKIMYGSFWKHVLGYWKQRTLPNLLIIAYEDLKKDLPSVIRKVAKFLHQTVTDQQMDLLTKHLSFESMKNNNSVNFHDLVERRKERKMACKDGVFIRSGKVGKYKEEMSHEMIEKFDDWTKRCITDTGFDEEFSYML